MVRGAGCAGIPCIDYFFSLAGVYDWTRGPYARGGAESVGFGVPGAAHLAPDPDAPIPDGVIWNMRYRPAVAGAKAATATSEEMWDRLERFLKGIIPVAEEAGGRLGAHPDDPPAETLRGTGRIVNRPVKYDRLLSLVASPANGLEMCLGTFQEMPGGDIYDHVRRFVRTAYIHFRNVKGKNVSLCRTLHR